MRFPAHMSKSQIIKEKIMTMLIAAAGVAILFLGRELSFLVSGIMAMLIGLRLVPLLPAGWPAWADLAFILGLGALGVIITLLDKRAGYYVTGFLLGGYVFLEIYAPNSLTIPLLPFIVGSVLGTLFVGILTDWAMIIVSCLVGTYLIYTVLPLYGSVKTLAAAGIFVIGAIVQVVIFQAQKHSDR
jgi:hypothetical protein